VSYDSAAKRLRFVGGMTGDERTELVNLSEDGHYRLAVDNLYNMRRFDGNDLAINGQDSEDTKISRHTGTILAALRISAFDLAALIATEVTDDVLSLENLSRLYAFSVLAKALKISVRDLVSLKTLMGVDPFRPGDPSSTVTFVEKARKVRQS